jgi:hypothetical protein
MLTGPTNGNVQHQMLHSAHATALESANHPLPTPTNDHHAVHTDSASAMQVAVFSVCTLTALSDPGLELDDSIVKRAMDIIAAQFPGALHGLQDPLLPALQAADGCGGFRFGNNGRVAQIHHCAQLQHWILSCEQPHSHGPLGAQAGEVAVFDSLRASAALSNKTIRNNLFAIAYGPRSTADSLRVGKRAAQIQLGSTQCGDFCIAWLVAFAFGDDLDSMSRSAFDQARMRTHIRQCLALGRFERFPAATSSDSVQFSSGEIVVLTK